MRQYFKSLDVHPVFKSKTYQFFDIKCRNPEIISKAEIHVQKPFMIE